MHLSFIRRAETQYLDKPLCGEAGSGHNKMVQPLLRRIEQQLRKLQGIYPLTQKQHFRVLPSITSSNTKKIVMVIYYSIVCNAEYSKQPKCPYVRNCLNKLQHVHTMKQHIAIKTNKEELYELIQSDIQIYGYMQKTIKQKTKFIKMIIDVIIL